MKGSTERPSPLRLVFRAPYNLQPAVGSFDKLRENHAIDRLMISVSEKNALVQAGDGEQTMKALCLAALFRADASINKTQVGS